MAETRRLLGVFGAIVVVIVLGTAILAMAGGSGASDGEDIRGQSPQQFQPENVNPEVDPERGNIRIDAEADSARILVDTRHGNEVDETELEPVAEAVFGEGHAIEFGDNEGQSGSRRGRTGGDDDAPYSATLEKYDGVLIVQPTEEFSDNETEAIQEYTDAGGRVVVLAEPTQFQSGGGGLFAAPSAVSFGANDLTREYGVRIGAEALYNMNDEQTDNNFKSIYASPEADGELTEDVERVNFDRAGYAVVRNAQVVDTLYSAEGDTRTLDTRRTGEYPMVVRNDNFVFVSDTTFIEDSDVYDVDNEVFVGNLLAFLAAGDVGPDFGPDGGDAGAETPRAPPEPPETPTPPAGTPPGDQPPETPTPPGETPPG